MAEVLHGPGSRLPEHTKETGEWRKGLAHVAREGAGVSDLRAQNGVPRRGGSAVVRAASLTTRCCGRAPAPHSGTEVFRRPHPQLREMCACRACVPWQAMRRSLLVAGVAATLLADPAAVRARARADLAGAHLLDACARRQRAPAAACRHPRGTCAIHSRLTAQAHARQLIIAPDANASALTDANAWALGFSYLLRV